MIATATRERVVDKETGEIRGVFAKRLMPMPRVRPSEWGHEHIILPKELSPTRPGPFDAGWKPWTRAIMDALHNEPNKKGLVVVKRAQVGLSTMLLIMLLQQAMSRGGPMLYMISDKEQAKHFSAEMLTPMLNGNPDLARHFSDAVEIEDRRVTMISRPFTGGRIDFAGGGTASGVSSRPYRVVVVDEIETIEDNFPGLAGSPWAFAKARTQTMEEVALHFVFSHPRVHGSGLWPIYMSESDQRSWCFDCPECTEVIWPDWNTQVRYDGESSLKSDGLGTVDPHSARWHCPHCDHVITEAERRIAVWPIGTHEGATGRLYCRLDPELALTRDYIGIQAHGLADPDIPIASIAKLMLACNSEKELQTVHNLYLGEPYSSKSHAITVNLVKECIKVQQKFPLPRPPMGVHPMLITAGVDVQAPEHNPTFYASCSAYTGTGCQLVLDLQKLSGWAALFEWLAESAFAYDGDPGTKYGITHCGIDCGYLTGLVLDNCRRQVISRCNHSIVRMVPLRFEPYVKSTFPAVVPSKNKLIDPTRPEDGELKRYDLCRDTWVGRGMKRYVEAGRRVVLCQPPADFEMHATANIQVPAPDVHKVGGDALVWEKIKNRRDDWQMALTYDECVAALECGLDSVHQFIAPRESEKRRTEEETSGGNSVTRGIKPWWRR